MIEIQKYYKNKQKDVELDHFIKAILNQIQEKDLSRVSKILLEIRINNYLIEDPYLTKLRIKRFGEVMLESNSFYFYEYFPNNKKPFKHIVEFSR